jgi:hypothetical protein
MATATKIIRVGIDAAYDLGIAGLDRDRADEMEAAWTEAVEAIGERLAADGYPVDIEAVSTTYESSHQADNTTTHPIPGPHGGDPISEETVEGVIWQSAHDLTHDGPDGWAYDPQPLDRHVAAIERALRHTGIVAVESA